MCLSLYDVNRIENIRLNKKLKGNWNIAGNIRKSHQLKQKNAISQTTIVNVVQKSNEP